MRRVPVFSTIVVAAACLTMVALGFWQLDRRSEKEALLERYASAASLSSEVAFPATEQETDERLFRLSSVICARVAGISARAGRNDRDATGWAHIADCVTRSGRTIPVAIGFSRQPSSPEWDGGKVTGWVAPGPRLVSVDGLAGLERLAPPDPKNVPNNHLAYAGQWFFFALTALVIYSLALRRRWRSR